MMLLNQTGSRATASKRLLVGSVFYESERNKFWIDTQLKFLRQNSPPFDHVVFLNKERRKGIFSETQIIGTNFDVHTENACENHAFGLTRLMEYFRTKNYEGYLILDSDCWPCVDDWYFRLLDLLNAHGKLAAAPIRFENLDVFPHPCAFFFTKYYLMKVKDEIWKPTNKLNLMGRNARDPGTAIPVHDVYPMIRTNMWNPHPVCAAVYGDMFYHHGCGSRVASQRSMEYYNVSVNQNVAIEADLFSRLSDNPESFVESLRLHRRIK